MLGHCQSIVATNMTHFYYNDFNTVAEKIMKNRIPITSLFSIIPHPEDVFPTGDCESATEDPRVSVIKRNRQLSHNYAFFQFTLLSLIGFEVVDPRQGIFKIKPIGVLYRDSKSPPIRISEDEELGGVTNEECLEAFRILKRILQSLAFLGFAPHVKEICNLIQSSKLSLVLPQASRVAAKNSWTPWDMNVLYPILFSDSYRDNDYLTPQSSDRLTVQDPPPQRLTEIALKASKGTYRLRVCEHGLLLKSAHLPTSEVVFKCIYAEHSSGCGIEDKALDMLML